VKAYHTLSEEMRGGFFANLLTHANTLCN